MTSLPLPHTSGVYQIRCIPTGKIYLGSAVNLRKRWEQHYRSLRKGEHGLHPVKMHNLKSGKIQRYKGWTWSEEERHDK